MKTPALPANPLTQSLRFLLRWLIPTQITAAGLLACAQTIPGTIFEMPPDLTTNGLVVLATFGAPVTPPGQPTTLANRMLADDFYLSDTNTPTQLHLWCGWLNDRSDTNTVFSVSLCWDLPPGMEGIPWSRPREAISSFQLAAPEPRIVATNAPAAFWDPDTGAVLGTSIVVWEYCLPLPPLPTSNVLWWAIQAKPSRPECAFGVRKSSAWFLDTTVLGVNSDFGSYPTNRPVGVSYTPWIPPFYPELPGTDPACWYWPFDLAFSLTTNAAPVMPPRLAIVRAPLAVQVTAAGSGGRSTVLEGSPDLAQWTGLITNAVSTGPWTFDYTDPLNGRRFYRVVVR